MKTPLKIALLSLTLTSGAAYAEVNIQSAQYKDRQGVLFLKGKSDHTMLYVVNPASNTTIATISTSRGQFKENLSVGSVPCKVSIQENAPAPAAALPWWMQGSGATSGSSDPGDSDSSNVRHAPADCS